MKLSEQIHEALAGRMLSKFHKVRTAQLKRWLIESTQLETENKQQGKKLNRFAKMLAISETEVERLRERVGIAYWHGHTEGRVYGRKGISKEEIERGTDWIAGALARDVG
jgi:hypothetical protein